MKRWAVCFGYGCMLTIIFVFQFEKNVKKNYNPRKANWGTYLNIKLCHLSKIVRMCQNKKRNKHNILLNVIINYVVEGFATIQVIFVS